MEIKTIIALSVGAVILLIVTVYIAVNQKKKVVEWLKWAVTEAEKLLGSGTGQLKLRRVYDWFVAKFPVIAAIVPFRVFSAWVDVAIETMRDWLGTNKNVAGYIGGESYEDNEKEQP